MLSALDLHMLPALFFPVHPVLFLQMLSYLFLLSICLFSPRYSYPCSVSFSSHFSLHSSSPCYLPLPPHTCAFCLSLPSLHLFSAFALPPMFLMYAMLPSCYLLSVHMILPPPNLLCAPTMLPAPPMLLTSDLWTMYEPLFAAPWSCTGLPAGALYLQWECGQTGSCCTAESPRPGQPSLSKNNLVPYFLKTYLMLVLKILYAILRTFSHVGALSKED